MGPALEKAGAGFMVWAGPGAGLQAEAPPFFFGLFEAAPHRGKMEWVASPRHSPLPGLGLCARTHRAALVIAAGNGNDLCILPAAAGPALSRRAC